MRAGVKHQSPTDDNGNLVDRLDQLVQSIRDWASIELKLIKSKAEFAARSYVLAFGAFLVAILAAGTAIVLLAAGAVVALAPLIGLAGAYVAIAFCFVLLSAILAVYAYQTVKHATAHATAIAGEKGRGDLP